MNAKPHMSAPCQSRRRLPLRALAAPLSAWQMASASLLGAAMPHMAHAQQTQSTSYGYDAQGNLTSIQDPNGKLTVQTPDALNRIVAQKLPRPTPSSPVPALSYTYYGLSHVSGITDARGVKTNSFPFGLGDTYTIGKDGGKLFAYANANGDTYYQINARNVTRNTTRFDPLNRPLQILYHDELPTGVIYGMSYLSYDAYVTTPGSENYGRGHLTQVTEYPSVLRQNAVSSLSFRYDQLGRMTWRCQFVSGASAGSDSACDSGDALQYRWAPNTGSQAGRLMGLTYPSGRMVDYQFDAQGRVSTITTTDPGSGGATKTVITGASYVAQEMAARGYAVAAWRFGDSSTPAQSYARSYDSWARVSGFTLGKGAVGLQPAQASYSLIYDDAGRLKQINNTSASLALQSNVYTYDDLNRLQTASLPGGTNYSYDHDLNGNRLVSTTGSTTTNYTYATSSNKLSTVQVGSGTAQPVSHDSTGNITLDPASPAGSVTYTYDNAADVPYGRVASSTGPGAQWRHLYNYFGQRIRKSGASYAPSGGSTITPAPYIGSSDTQFYYDMDGHLIAEVDASAGASVTPKPVKREYIWLGDTLVGIIAGSTPSAPISATNAAALYFVHTDHLNTPRLVTDTAGNRRWSWELMTAEPYGMSPANEAPAAQSTAQAFTLNIRFPGQYLDKETGSFYNHFRTYNPRTGRYVQSDPIGFAGGLNTYAYVGGNPVSLIDPSGLVWEYSQSNGTLQHFNESTGARGPVYSGLYSGYMGNANNSSAQHMRGVGPIPQGPYIIGPQYDHKGGLGKGVLNLTPDTSNPTSYAFSRDLFRIHGDNGRGNQSGSEGCVIAPRNLRDLIGASGDNRLWVLP